jgi:hypothetical protein
MQFEDGYLELTTQCQGCFSANAHRVRVELWPGSAVVRHGPINAPCRHELAREVGERLVARIMDILNRPEKVRGDRLTMVHKAEVEWRLGAFGGSQEAYSSDFGQEQLEDLTSNRRNDPKLQARLLEALADDSYSWAYELYVTTRALEEELHNAS